MIERPDQSPESPLTHRRGQVDARGLGLLHQIGEGQNGVAADDVLGFPPTERDDRAGLTAHDAGVRDPAGKRLREEVSEHLLHLPAAGRIG